MAWVDMGGEMRSPSPVGMVLLRARLLQGGDVRPGVSAWARFARHWATSLTVIVAAILVRESAFPPPDVMAVFVLGTPKDGEYRSRIPKAG